MQVDELRQRGHGDAVPMLTFERPRPDDTPAAALTRSTTREQVDVWISAAPLDRIPGRIRNSLGG